MRDLTDHIFFTFFLNTTKNSLYIQSIKILDRYEDASPLNIFSLNVGYIIRKLY